MKTSTLLLALALATAAVAFAPSAQAAQIPPIIVCVTDPCPPFPPPATPCTLEQATPGDNPYYTPSLRERVWGNDAGCDIDVETNWYCLFGGIPVDRTVGPVHVETIVCTPNLPPIDFVELQ